MAKIQSLEMVDISKSFQGVKANSDINITVREGEILGLLGAPGQGNGVVTSLENVLVDDDESISVRCSAGEALVRRLRQATWRPQSSEATVKG